MLHDACQIVERTNIKKLYQYIICIFIIMIMLTLIDHKLNVVNNYILILNKFHEVQK